MEIFKSESNNKRYTEKVLELLISFMTFHYKRVDSDPSFDEAAFMTFVVELTKLEVTGFKFSNSIFNFVTAIYGKFFLVDVSLGYLDGLDCS